MNGLQQYLRRHAEPALDVEGTWSFGVTIPAYAENRRIDSCVAAIARCQAGAVVILVVNEPSHAPADARANNARLLERWPPGLHRRDGCTVLSLFRVLEHGVGEARKIGLDALLHLWAKGQLGSNWLCTTDADAVVPPDYFARLPGQPCPACVFPFTHVAEQGDAAVQYELSLRHYVAGLQWAGSPYAFHSIGSTIAVDARCYALVRGCPKRKAGEDFYLLNKLRKLGPVQALTGTPIRLSARRSQRTPFGTGRAASRGDIRAYHPKIFAHLRQHLIEETAQLRPAAARLFHDQFDGLRTLQFVHRHRAAGLLSLPVHEAASLAPWLS